jgi:hypothetical protein
MPVEHRAEPVRCSARFGDERGVVWRYPFWTDYVVRHSRRLGHIGPPGSVLTNWLPDRVTSRLVARTAVPRPRQRPTSLNRGKLDGYPISDRGMWLCWWDSPRLVTLRLYNPEGPRIRAWLNDEGTYDLEAPVSVTA